MNTSTQVFSIVITSVIAATLIVGVILISIALFRIKAALKKRNLLFEQTNRPYIICQKSGNQLFIKNLGNMLGQIDEIQTNLNHDFTYLNKSYISAGQTFTYNIEETDNLIINLSYHGQNSRYADKFDLSIS